MVMLDLSVAYDTIDYTSLLECRSPSDGIRCQSHAWIQSHLTDRTEFVILNGQKSEEHKKGFGVH